MLISAEITRHDHSIIACSFHIYMVLFFAHIPFVVNRAFQCNVSGVVATIPCVLLENVQTKYIPVFFRLKEIENFSAKQKVEKCVSTIRYLYNSIKGYISAGLPLAGTRSYGSIFNTRYQWFLTGVARHSRERQ